MRTHLLESSIVSGVQILLVHAREVEQVLVFLSHLKMHDFTMVNLRHGAALVEVRTLL